MNNDLPYESVSFNDIDSLDDDALNAIISESGNRLVFDVPMHSVGFTNEPNDIAQDYIDAAFFTENMAKHCNSIDVNRIELKHGMLMRFTISVTDVSSLIAELRRILPWFDTENHEPDDALRDEVGEFFDHFLESKLRIPELGDSYMANFLAGSRYQENRREYYKKHPTWRWGFWRSFASDSIKCEFYTSSILQGVWIIAAGRETVERLLREYGGFTEEGSRLYDATSLKIDGSPHLLVTAQTLLQVPYSRLGKAVKCWKRSIRSEQERRGSWEYRFGFRWAMTESGDALVCGDDQVSFVAFTTSLDRLRPESLRDIVISAEHALDMLQDHAGLKQSVPLDWDQVLPEQFEDLCYEVLLRSGRFDEKTIRKHGKTRSRDGGRDIEAWTLPRFDRPSVKWIFQCKHITSRKSLSGTMVTVSDVVDQFAASGFGVMTNEVIDSTLYDKMDAIAKNRAIQIDFWDGRRLQRFIAARRDLLQRYFQIH